MPPFTDTGAFPKWLWILAFLWSAYQGYAGYVYGLFIHGQAGEKVNRHWFIKHSVYGVHHAFLYFSASLLGFLLLQVVSTVVTRIGSWSELSAGTGALLVGLATISIAGVSGALAGLLYRGAKIL